MSRNLNSCRRSRPSQPSPHRRRRRCPANPSMSATNTDARMVSGVGVGGETVGSGGSGGGCSGCGTSPCGASLCSVACTEAAIRRGRPDKRARVRSSICSSQVSA